MLELSLSRERSATLQDQIVQQVRAFILSGSLRPGAELPSSRELAAQYDLSRNTITHAYDRLIDEGYLVTAKGIGTKVTTIIPDTCQVISDAAYDTGRSREPLARAPTVFKGETLHVPARPHPKPAFDFWPGRPNREHFPLATWRRLADEVLATSAGKLVEYGEPAGLPELREAIARHVSISRGFHCSAETIVITAGTQESLNLLARMFVEPGTGIVIENPAYGSAAHTFESYGARLHPVPVDIEGLDTDCLPEDRVSLAYVTPSHQFPTGAAMSSERRTALIDWSIRTGTYLIEEDYDCDFTYSGRPLLSLAGASHSETVIYLGTFSKALGAGVRTGFIIFPRHLMAVALAVKKMTNYGHPWLEQAILAAFLRGETFQRHLRHIRKAYLDTLQQLTRRLTADFGPVDLWGAQSGMHVMWHLPRWVGSAQAFKARLQAAGVYVHTLASAGAYDRASGYAQSSILLGYAALSGKDVLAAAGIMARVARNDGQDVLLTCPPERTQR